jgi:hypothetical protein
MYRITEKSEGTIVAIKCRVGGGALKIREVEDFAYFFLQNWRVGDNGTSICGSFVLQF